MHLLVVEDDPRLGRIPVVGAVAGIVGAALIGALAGLYPALRAANASPTDALRD